MNSKIFTPSPLGGGGFGGKIFEISGTPVKNRELLLPGRLLREAAQKVGIFLGCPFFCRRAPHSDAFFTSVIQIVSGIRYEDAAFFLCAKPDFLAIFLKMFFMACFLQGRQKMENFVSI